MKFLKIAKPHLIAIAIFIVTVFAYFAPLIEGKDIQQMDISHAAGMSNELKQYHDKTGEYGHWTTAMFSGMPAYHVGPYTANYNIFSYLNNIFSLSFSSNSTGIIFVMMLTFYFLLLVMGVNPWLSIVGALAYAFSTYNFIILGAGHVTKAWVIAYIPLVVAGIMLLYKGKYLPGAIVSVLGIGLNISRNHMQITYYTGILSAILVMGFFIYSIRQKEVKTFITASLILLGCALLAVLPNAMTFYTNYELSKESIRGKSDLTIKDESRKGGGLDKDYAFSWSYGIAESFSVLIPNFMGGASGMALTTDSELYKELEKNGVANPKQYIKQVPAYWGDMPFTSGPAYHGAIICFLFILGIWILRHPIRWWLLAATILSFMLAWGRNFEWFNDFMFYYFPMYSKFRTVSMSLVIAQFTMPLLAILAVWEFITHLEDKKRMLDGLKWAAIITGGACLVFFIMPGAFFDFIAVNDSEVKSQVPDWFYNALLLDRASLLRADAMRSFIFILLAGFILWAALNNTRIVKYTALALGLLIISDMWTIDKRFLNNEDFVRKNKKNDFPMSASDKYILSDTDPSYRVLNLNNPFAEVNTSYYHKSIGGYHGAKLRRYQELFENRIQPEMSSLIQVLSKGPTLERVDSVIKRNHVLNMLNTRYIVYNQDATPIRNRHAYGNAWFADSIRIVKNADEEMSALAATDPSRVALVDARFTDKVAGYNPSQDSSARIRLLSYAPDTLRYEYSAATKRLAVFSEVYYDHGWNAYVDGNLIPHFRTNWILRGAILPEGSHKLEFRFEPRNLYASQKTTIAGSILIGLLLMGGCLVLAKKHLKETSAEQQAKA